MNISKFMKNILHKPKEKHIIFESIQNFLGKNNFEEYFNKFETKGSENIEDKRNEEDANSPIGKLKLKSKYR